MRVLFLGLLSFDAWMHDDVVSCKDGQSPICRAVPGICSPGTQLIGVVTLFLSPVCKESTTRSTSAVLRPVEAGYESIRRMVFFGSMTKTLRMVNAIPFWSTLVVSWWSSMSYAYATFLSLSPMIGNLSWLPEISSMSLIHPPCESTVLAERPISFTPRLVNSGSNLAKAPNSVVHTGV